MENKIEKTTDELLELGVKIATAVSIDWFDLHPEATYNLDALIECVRSNMKMQFPQALNDAKEALDIGMDKIAVMTFIASMNLVGIDSAKEAAILKPITSLERE